MVRTLSRDPGDADSLLGALVDVDLGWLTVRSTVASHGRTVHLSGDLDLWARPELSHLLMDGGGLATEVDLSELVFMDCAGYGELATACTGIRGAGGSLRLSGAHGQPQVLLRSLDELRLSHSSIDVA